jgi:hypothetical protein
MPQKSKIKHNNTFLYSPSSRAGFYTFTKVNLSLATKTQYKTHKIKLTKNIHHPLKIHGSAKVEHGSTLYVPFLV